MAVSKGSGLTPQQTPRPAALSGWPGGGIKTVFCGAGGGIKLVRTLVPIAVNARKPQSDECCAMHIST